MAEGGDGATGALDPVHGFFDEGDAFVVESEEQLRVEEEAGFFEVLDDCSVVVAVNAFGTALRIVDRELESLANEPGHELVREFPEGALGDVGIEGIAARSEDGVTGPKFEGFLEKADEGVAVDAAVGVEEAEPFVFAVVVPDTVNDAALAEVCIGGKDLYPRVDRAEVLGEPLEPLDLLGAGSVVGDDPAEVETAGGQGFRQFGAEDRETVGVAVAGSDKQRLAHRWYGHRIPLAIRQSTSRS